MSLALVYVSEVDLASLIRSSDKMHQYIALLTTLGSIDQEARKAHCLVRAEGHSAKAVLGRHQDVSSVAFDSWPV
jgi:hypothetical protein